MAGFHGAPGGRECVHMKILIVPSAYPDAENPVSDIFIAEQAQALADSGNEMRVLHLKQLPSRRVFATCDRTIRKVDDGFALRFCRPIKTFMENRFASLHKTAFVSGMSGLYEAATADGWLPDLLYSHFACWAGAAAVELGKKHGIPVAHLEHYSQYCSPKVNPFKVKTLKEVAEGADVMMAVSEKLKTNIVKKTGFSKTISVVPNMVNEIFRFQSVPTLDHFVFCCICNLNTRKRVDILIKAFCDAFSEDENVFLQIGGDGPERHKLEMLVARRGRARQIRFLGRLNRAQTVELYGHSHCFALVSAHETFGIVWREAMAVGLPVVTSNHEGWDSDNWSDDYGLMVGVDDIPATARALRYMKEHIFRFDRKTISERCLSHHSASTIAEKLQNEFRKILAMRGLQQYGGEK